MKFPALKLSSTSIATTYSFKPADPTEFGWATCTVNDATCELSIHSDWGEWSYGWWSGNFGADQTLTSFIGTRTGADYLANKLQKGNGMQWSAEATVKALCKQLCAVRLRDGRGQIENRLEPMDLEDDGSVPLRWIEDGTHDEQGLALLSDDLVKAPTWTDPDRHLHKAYLTRATAREIWHELHGELLDFPSQDLFLERISKIDGFTEHVTDDPWSFCEQVPTTADQVLRQSILPALIAACRETAVRREQPA